MINPNFRLFVHYRLFSHATSAVLMCLLLLAIVPYTSAQNEDRKSDGFSFDPKLGLNPSMAIIFVCLLSAFFIMGCVSVSIRHCSLHHPADVFREDRVLSPAMHRGLDSSIIEGFPICKYSDVKELRIGKCVLECAVCLNEFSDEETLRLIPSCSHVFHPECIDAWLSSHVTCPVCRANLDQKLSVPVPAQDLSSLGIHIHIGSPELINQDRTTAPVFLKTSSLRFEDKILRSHSTGHVPVHPKNDCERFTLRLPEDVRTRLIKSELSRARSCVAFTRVRSSTRGFRRNNNVEGTRANSINRGRLNREVRSDQFGSSMFLSGSDPGTEGISGEKSASLRNLLWPTKSFRAPLERLLSETRRKEEFDGERSFRNLMLQDFLV